jgi:biotin operon repressor
METAEKVIKAMKKAGKPLSACQIAEMTGTDRKEVDKAIKVLQKEKKIVSPRHCYWEPK